MVKLMYEIDKEMDMREPDNKPSEKLVIPPGWCGKVYGVDADAEPIEYVYDGAVFEVGFGKNGADLRIEFTIPSVTHVIQTIGQWLMLDGAIPTDSGAPVDSDEGVASPRSLWGENRWTGTMYEVAEWGPVDLRWWGNAIAVRFGVGPESLTVVLSRETVGWLVFRVGEWWSLRTPGQSAEGVLARA